MKLTDIRRSLTFLVVLSLAAPLAAALQAQDRDSPDTPFGNRAFGISASDPAAGSAAQEDRPLQGRRTRRAPEYGSVDWNEEKKLISVRFRGGDVRKYVELLQDNVPSINVIVQDEAGRVEIPEIVLNKVQPESALYCLHNLSSDRARIELDEQNGIIVIGARIERPSLRVLNVKRILAELPEEDFLSAIEIGMNMIESDSNSIEMQLHDETGLLFFKGTEAETGLIIMVVDGLQQQMRDGARGGADGGGDESPNSGRSRKGPRGIGGGGTPEGGDTTNRGK